MKGQSLLFCVLSPFPIWFRSSYVLFPLLLIILIILGIGYSEVSVLLGKDLTITYNLYKGFIAIKFQELTLSFEGVIAFSNLSLIS